MNQQYPTLQSLRPLKEILKLKAELLEKQGGMCADCGKKDMPLQLEHNHYTGEIRGLVCRSCNLMRIAKDNAKYPSPRLSKLLDGNRVTIPAEWLEKLGVKVGDPIILENNEGRFTINAADVRVKGQ